MAVHLLSELMLYTRVIAQSWALVFMIWILLVGSWAVHLIVIGGQGGD